MHTALNKITGFLLFIFPLTLAFIELKYSLILICIVATVSAVQEYYYILHDWILNVKHNKADNVKSNAYKINQSIKAFYANLKSKK